MLILFFFQKKTKWTYFKLPCRVFVSSSFWVLTWVLPNDSSADLNSTKFQEFPIYVFDLWMNNRLLKMLQNYAKNSKFIKIIIAGENRVLILLQKETDQQKQWRNQPVKQSKLKILSIWAFSITTCIESLLTGN